MNTLDVASSEAASPHTRVEVRLLRWLTELALPSLSFRG